MGDWHGSPLRPCRLYKSSNHAVSIIHPVNQTLNMQVASCQRNTPGKWLDCVKTAAPKSQHFLRWQSTGSVVITSLFGSSTCVIGSFRPLGLPDSRKGNTKKQKRIHFWSTFCPEIKEVTFVEYFLKETLGYVMPNVLITSASPLQAWQGSGYSSATPLQRGEAQFHGRSSQL